MDGTPVDEVTKTPELAVVNAAIVLALLAYNKVLAAFVPGQVLVDQAGVVDAPDNKSLLAVAVPDNIAPADPVL